MSHPLQNWKCKCGRGPSLEHGIGEYCSGRIVIEGLEAERDALRAELEKFKDGANKSICTYCGHVGPKDVETMLQHMVVCEKHPTMKMIEKANELLEDRDRWRSLAEKARDYLVHDQNCIRSFCSAGEPTPDGGYRSMFKGKWYQSRPINEEPKCDCGLDEVIVLFPPFSEKCKGHAFTGGIHDGACPSSEKGNSRG